MQFRMLKKLTHVPIRKFEINSGIGDTKESIRRGHVKHIFQDMNFMLFDVKFHLQSVFKMAVALKGQGHEIRLS